MSASIDLIVGSERVLAQQISITKTIDSLCDTFNLQMPFQSLSVVDKPIQIIVDDMSVMVGYINSIDHAVPANNNTITFAGRSMSQDIIDSRITHVAHNQTLAELATVLFAKFEQKFTTKVETKIIKDFSIVAESAFESLNQLAKSQNLIFVENNDGSVELVEPANVDNSHLNLSAANLENFKVNENLSAFFYQNTVKTNPGKDNLNPNAHNNFKFNINIDRIRKTRIQEVIADKLTDLQACEDRAQEIVSLAKSQSITASGTSQGWLNPDDNLWQPNSLYTIQNEKLLLASATFNQSGNNRTTSLSFKGHNDVG
jgi:prophage tail gpP-like protein